VIVAWLQRQKAVTGGSETLPPSCSIL